MKKIHIMAFQQMKEVLKTCKLQNKQNVSLIRKLSSTEEITESEKKTIFSNTFLRKGTLYESLDELLSWTEALEEDLQNPPILTTPLQHKKGKQ